VGGSWSADSAIGYLGNWRCHNWYPSCALDPAGRLYIVWESNEWEYPDGNYDLSYTSVSNGVWTGQQHLVASASNTWHPVVAATADGRVHVCWQDDRSGGFKLFHKYFNGAAWSGDLAVADSAVYASFPSLVPYGGGLGLVWQDYRSGVDQIHFSEYSGAAWGPDSAVSHSSQGAFAPSLACDGGGNFHLVWEDWRDGNSEIFYRRYDRAGRAWGPEVLLSGGAWRSREPVAVCRGDTLVDVFWSGDQGGCYRIVGRRALRGVWGAETTVTAGLADQRGPAAAADSRGNLYLVWSDFRDTYHAPTLLPDLFFASDIVDPWPKSAWPPADRPQAADRPALRVYPNPARGSATIDCAPGQPLQQAATIRIYSITGQLVRTIAVPAAAAGNRAVPWDGSDQAGRAVASGVYLITLSPGGGTSVAKLTLVR